VLQRERKKRTEAAEAFHAAGREEQAEKEEAELAVLEEFMPEPLAEEELERIVDDAIAECKATNMRDMGRVMADVMPADRRPRGRVGGEPARAREARVIERVELGPCAAYDYEADGPTAVVLPGRMLGGMPAVYYAMEPLLADGWRVVLVWWEAARPLGDRGSGCASGPMLRSTTRAAPTC